MEKLTYPLIFLEEDKLQVKIDKRLYSPDAITATLYKYSHLYYIHQQIDENNTNLINIIFESIEKTPIPTDIPKKFCNDLIDQQIRHNIDLQFGEIRKIIVNEAFKPVNTKK